MQALTLSATLHRGRALFMVGTADFTRPRVLCRRTKAAKVEPAVELLASINLQALGLQQAAV